MSDRILNAMPGMLILYDINATILDIRNPDSELIFYSGNKKEPVRLTKELSEQISEHFKMVHDTQRPVEFIYCHTMTDGKEKVYDICLSSIDREYIFVHISLIHEKSVDKIESRHIYRFFAEALDNIAIPVSVKSINTGYYVYWNKKAEMFGYTAGKMIGGTEDLYMIPEQAKAVQKLKYNLAEGKEKQYQGVEKYRTSDGREHTFIVTRTMFTFGQEKFILSSALDISELTETKKSLMNIKNELANKNMILTSVLSLADIIPWGCDLEAKTFYCDYNIFHPENCQEPDSEGRYTVTLKSHFERIHPDYRIHTYDQYMDLVEGRIREFHEVYPILWNNDIDYEWLEMQGSIYRINDQGNPTQLIGSARIVTPQKQMEESLRKAKEQAERSNMFKSAFLANMSHEIRTPLNAIVGFSELLAQTDEPEEKEEYLSIIHNSNTMLLQLIADILDLSKIEAGTLEFTFAEYDLNAIMEELEHTTRMKVDNPAIEIACTNHTRGCTIHTDRNRLMQVLHNFIGNSSKFTQKGHIHFGYRKQNDGRWYFYVEDTGCGIQADKVGSVFDRFVKLDQEAKGTGLGLAISKSIVERLGGEIGVFSAEGQGSTFWFLLPANSVTQSDYTKETYNGLPKSSCPKQSSATILVAEDDLANYKLFEAMLKNNYKLIHAWDGSQAIEMYREYKPDIILMDIKMPKMDGYQATAAIREISTDVPIVAVTAFAYPDDMRKILSSGFNGCLPKPVSADKLKKKISELCYLQ